MEMRVEPAPVPSKAVQENKIEGFWRWFSRKSGELRREVTQSEDAYWALVNRLHLVSNKLTCHIADNGWRGMELIVGANSQAALFPLIVRLVDEAPRMPGWTVRAFTPRQRQHFQVMVDDKQMGTESSFYSYTAKSNGKLEMTVWFIDEEEMDWRHRYIAFVMLENLLGELVMGTRVGEIGVRRVDQEVENKALKPMIGVGSEVERLGGAN